MSKHVLIEICKAHVLIAENILKMREQKQTNEICYPYIQESINFHLFDQNTNERRSK
jgi:hypothetical protein